MLFVLCVYGSKKNEKDGHIPFFEKKWKWLNIEFLKTFFYVGSKKNTTLSDYQPVGIYEYRNIGLSD
jgi:hypothetical protein